MPSSPSSVREVAARARGRLGAAIAALGAFALPLAPSSPSLAATPALRLASQTTVVSISPEGTGQFSLALSGVGGSDTISTRLFSSLSTRSGFVAATGAAGPTGQIDVTAPIKASCLARSPSGAVRLSIAVLTGNAEPPAGRPCSGEVLAPTWQLSCTTGNGRCAGVYPIEVSISHGGEIRRIITFLTVAEGPARQTLRVATVLPLDGSATSSEATNLAFGLRDAPGVTADLAISPVAARRLNRSSQGQRSIARLTRAATGHEVVRTPFVSVDPGALSSSGLASQVEGQLERGERLLRQVGLRPVDGAGWVATSPVTPTTGVGLAQAGVTRLLVPDSSLATATSSTLSWGEPFTPTPGSGVVAMAADSILTAQTQPGDDPVLAAERLLADLALLHLERPSLSIPLGVVILPPRGWSPNRLFVSTLLRGLGDNPLVSSATLSSLYGSLQPGSNGVPTTRQLATSTPSSPWPSAQVASLAEGQARVAALRGAVTDGHREMRRLSEGYLAAESDVLSIPGRTAALDQSGRSVDAALASIGIGSSDITLTSLKGSLPITLTKTADWSVSGTLAVRSDHLRFPKGHVRSLVVNHPTQSIRIPVVAETTGDLTVSVTLTTPSGSLVIAHQRIVVRTTQTSALAIALTIGAALVLLVWWIRTTLRRPRRRALQ